MIIENDNVEAYSLLFVNMPQPYSPNVGPLFSFSTSLFLMIVLLLFPFAFKCKMKWRIKTRYFVMVKFLLTYYCTYGIINIKCHVKFSNVC